MFSASLSPIIPSAVALTYTISQTEVANNSTSARGQSFIPNDIGPNGSGTPPVSGTVTLDSWKFAYTFAPTVGTIYIYDTLPAANDPAGSLFSSTSFTDIASDAAFGNFPTRTWTFTGANLDVSTTYYALLPTFQGIKRSSNADVYTSGFRYIDNTTSLIASTNGDLAFTAAFSATTPVPFEFNPGLGLVLLGGGLAWRKLSKKKA